MVMTMIRSMMKYGLCKRVLAFHWVYFLLSVSSHLILSVLYRDQLRVATTTTNTPLEEQQQPILPTIHQPYISPRLLQQGNHSNITYSLGKKEERGIIDYFHDSVWNRTNDCHELAIFTAAFDNWTLQQFHTTMLIRQNYSQEMLESHGQSTL
jgi:hypothetical protein